jgi:valyl-tRNA synthetase
MSAPMAGAYEPKDVEAGWYDWWEGRGFFKPSDDASKEKFVVVLPPPNVTGTLHLGHTLTSAIQDTIVRWKRMQGKNVIWVPGTDHAGIATQVVVEKMLLKEEGLSRHDLGREKFLEKVWEWKNEYGGAIQKQLKRVGSSLDWSREAFSMDDDRSKSVREAFIRMFEKGLIYRSTRLVNWSSTLKTAISDIEVEYIDIEKKTRVRVPGYGKTVEFGIMVSFAYQVQDSDEMIVVATTRPETMLGDTAVAVHPDDPRYKHLHGKFVVHPFNERSIPIVLDKVLVDMSLGTGAVKITPAHDPNDFECGRRHNLEFINIFTDEGLINANGAPFEGMKRFDCRVAVMAELEKKGLMRGVAGHSMRLGLCSRSGDVIEPMVKPQWFVNCGDMARRSVEVVRSGELKIVPEFHKDTWYRWLENIRDWCISRQLWWGHQIPAFHAEIRGRPSVDSDDEWFAAHSKEEAIQKAATKFGVDEKDVTVTQDPDVLDTWFSAGLHPFSVMGWPDATKDMQLFFPNTLMETGHDILFFWVARMVMMSLELMDCIPFDTVFLHAMVRDKQGRKMSKTLGNVIDPLDVIEGIDIEDLHAKLHKGNLDKSEIARAIKGQKEQFPKGIPICGTDGLRFALLAYTSQGRDINLDIQRVVGYRQFCNKLWNATRFALINLEDFELSSLDQIALLEYESLEIPQKWILSKLNAAIVKMDYAMESFDMSAATSVCYSFWLYELCDVYLELMKPIMKADISLMGVKERKVSAQRVLYICIEIGLRLLHPMMPFVTEELWHRLPARSLVPEETCSIMVQEFPTAREAWAQPAIEEAMSTTQMVIHAFRSISMSYNITKERPTCFVVCTKDEEAEFLTTLASEIEVLSSVGKISVVRDSTKVPIGGSVKVVSDSITAFMLLKGLVDPEKEITRLGKKKDKLLKQKIGYEKKMSIKDYEKKVPEDVRELNTSKFEALKVEIDTLQEAITTMETLRD